MLLTKCGYLLTLPWVGGTGNGLRDLTPVLIAIHTLTHSLTVSDDGSIRVPRNDSFALAWPGLSSSPVLKGLVSQHRYPTGTLQKKVAFADSGLADVVGLLAKIIIAHHQDPHSLGSRICLPPLYLAGWRVHAGSYVCSSQSAARLAHILDQTVAHLDLPNVQLPAWAISSETNSAYFAHTFETHLSCIWSGYSIGRSSIT